MKLERVERLNLGLSAGAVAVSYALTTPQIASSLAIGAALEAINFGALHRSAKLYLGGEVIGAGPWVGLFGFRFAMLGVGIVVAMHAGAHPIALVCGLSIAMPAVLIDAWLHRPDFDPTSQAEYEVPPPEDESWDRITVWRVDDFDEKEDTDSLTDSDTNETTERAEHHERLR